MIRARLIEVRERRARLAECAQAERERLHAALAPADALTSWIGLARTALGEARRRPLVLAAAAALAVGLRPKATLRLLTSAWSLWQVYRRARRWWRIAQRSDAVQGGA